MFKLWSLTRKRSTPAKLLGTEMSIRISEFSLAADGSDDPNVSLEFWADDRRYVLQIPLDKVDSVCERKQASKKRQEQWMMEQNANRARRALGQNNVS